MLFSIAGVVELLPTFAYW